MNGAKLEEFVVYRTDRASRCRQYVKQIHNARFQRLQCRSHRPVTGEKEVGDV